MHVKWPLPSCNVEMLHRKWLRSEEDRLDSYHQKLLGFENALKVYQKKELTMWSQLRILFSFSMDSHFAKNLIGMGEKRGSFDLH